MNSGMMMPQYTAASLVLENQHLSTPDSIHSLPTSGGKEDHNANSLTAARHAFEIANNTAHILAVELYTAIRAIDIRLESAPHTGWARRGRLTAPPGGNPVSGGGCLVGAGNRSRSKQMVLDGELALKDF